MNSKKTLKRIASQKKSTMSVTGGDFKKTRGSSKMLNSRSEKDLIDS